MDEEVFDEQTYIHEMVGPKKKSFLALPKRNTIGKKGVAPVFYTIDELQAVCRDDTKVLLQEWLKTIPDRPYPTDLDEFNYKYNDKGKLVNKSTGEAFHWVNQRHYDALGDIVFKHIQKMMVKDFGYSEVWLPNDANVDISFKTNIFMSSDALTNPDKLMLLIQGSGAVRPGQWARALCINDTLENGAIFEYLKRARSDGYGVIVFNPNNNHVKENADKEARAQRQANADAEAEMKNVGGGGGDAPFMSAGKRYFMQPDLTKEQLLWERKNTRYVEISGSESPGDHVCSVWAKIASKAKAKELFIVAHSAGGYSTLSLLDTYSKDVLARLKAVAFTDAVHRVSNQNASVVRNFLMRHAINWVAAKTPLDTPEADHPFFGNPSGCPRVSAGHDTHEYTSAYAINSVFKHLKSKWSL